MHQVKEAMIKLSVLTLKTEKILEIMLIQELIIILTLCLLLKKYYGKYFNNVFPHIECENLI